METGNSDEGIGQGKVNEKFNYKRGKPPDKRRCQLEMSHYADLIHEKEAIFKSLKVPHPRKSASSVHGSRDELLAKLRALKSEKDQKMKEKQKIDAELKTLNQLVVKKNETCMKLQANIKYKDEQRINNAIKHLERHLSTHQLKLSEEKKLVCEIDALKRSKKTLSEYLCSKQEVDQLRQQQSRLRHDRDVSGNKLLEESLVAEPNKISATLVHRQFNNQGAILIRETHDIRARENDVKISLDSFKEDETDGGERTPAVDRDALKKEIDGLYEKRRELHENYKQALAKYHEEQKDMEKEMNQQKAAQKRDETRLTKIANDRARQETRTLHPKPYEEEKSICDCLIKYLEPLMVFCSSENEENDGNITTARYLDVPKCEAAIPEEGSYAINPDDHLGGLFAPSHRRLTRKGSRKGRKSKDSSAQKLVLHPHVFEQFFKLSLEPPSTYADVGGILDKLRAKKDFYEKQSGKSNQPLAVITEDVASKETGRKDADEHEKAMLEHDFDEAPHAFVTAEHEKESAQNDTLQSEHGIDESQHESDAAEHEVSKTERETDQVEHDIALTQHENGQVENENDKLVHGYIDDEDMSVYMNERSLCKNEEVLAENILNRTDGNEIDELACKEDPDKDILNSSCMNRSTVITDALEKGIDGIKIKETSPEIQVRVT